MSPDDITTHELIAVDDAGSLCSCGTRHPNWLEHLATIALAALGAPEARVRPSRSRWAA